MIVALGSALPKRWNLTVIAALTISIVCLWWHFSRAAKPPVSIQLAHYSRDALGNLNAHVAVTNVSPESIYFWLYKRGHRATLTSRGWITNRTGLIMSTDWVVMLEPGQGVLREVDLPPDVGLWRIGLEIHPPNTRMQLRKRLPKNVYAKMEGVIDRVTTGQETEPVIVWSREYDARELRWSPPAAGTNN
jgi:hypothetical protein